MPCRIHLPNHVYASFSLQSVGKGALSTQGNAPRMVSPNVPARSSTNTSSTPVTVTAVSLLQIMCVRVHKY